MPCPYGASARNRAARAAGTGQDALRDETEQTMAGLAPDQTLDQAGVDNVVQKVASVNMLRPLGKEELPEYGMDELNAVVTLETADKTITLRVGAQGPGGAGRQSLELFRRTLHRCL